MSDLVLEPYPNHPRGYVVTIDTGFALRDRGAMWTTIQATGPKTFILNIYQYVPKLEKTIGHSFTVTPETTISELLGQLL